MPLLRYFFCVGGCLLALLFASDAFVPKAPLSNWTDIDRSVIRIRATQRGPEPVYFDLSSPIVVALPAVALPVIAQASEPEQRPKLAQAATPDPVLQAFAKIPSGPIKAAAKIRKRKVPREPTLAYAQERFYAQDRSPNWFGAGN